MVEHVSNGERRIGLRIVAIQFDRPEQEIACLFEHFAALRFADRDQIAPAKEAVVGIDIAGAAARDAGLFGGAHGYL